MKKEQIVEVLETIATLLELKEENPFKIRAYTNAARSIETWGGNLREMAEEIAWKKSRAWARPSLEKSPSLHSPARQSFSTTCAPNFPPESSNCFPFPAWVRKRSRRFTRQLQVGSLRRSEEACAAGRVAELPGFGKTTQDKLALTIANRAKHAGSFQLGAVAAEAEMLQDDLRQHPDGAGEHCRKLSAPERNCARSRFHRRHEGAGRDH